MRTRKGFPVLLTLCLTLLLVPLLAGEARADTWTGGDVTTNVDVDNYTVSSDTTINFSGNKSLEINHSFTVPTGKTLTITGPGTLVVKNGATLTVESGGTLIIENSCTLRNYGTSTIRGTVTNNADFDQGGTLTVESGGTVTNNYGFNQSGTLTVSGTFTQNGNNPITNGGTVEIASGGTLTINSGKSLANSGTVTVNSGGALTVSGQLTIGAGRTLTNNGTLTINSGGSLSNVGTLTNHGAVTLTVTPDEGKELKSLTVEHVGVGKVETKDRGNGVHTFSMPGGNVKIGAEFGTPEQTAANAVPQQTAIAAPEQTVAAPTPTVSMGADDVRLSPQRFMANGVELQLAAYNINGSNYVMLRDLAAMLRGTPAQFNVSYDERTNRVVITTGMPYSGDISSDFVDQSASAVVSPQSFEVDGREFNLTAYNIGGSNYFQARDLSAILGFGVEYDATTNTVLITSK